MLSADRSRPPAGLTVAIVEDDGETRARLCNSILANPEIELTGAFASGQEALAALADNAPDVLLVDLGLGDMSGLDVIRYVSRHHPHCDTLVVTMFGDEAHVLSALQAGARGYLLKDNLTRDITADISDLRNGGSPLSPIIARQVLKQLHGAPTPPRNKRPSGSTESGANEILTARETEILRTIARGFTYAETARLQGVSMQTVHTHLKRIYRKLAVHSKTEAVFEADARNLL